MTIQLLKGVDKKNSLLIFCFAHISATIHRIFKILVPNPTPLNIPLISLLYCALIVYSFFSPLPNQKHSRVITVLDFCIQKQSKETYY